MIITVDESMFVSAFKDYDRVGKGKNFSYPAVRALFEYYDELDDGCGTNTELDVIAICCDWAEYDMEDLINDYGYIMGDDEVEEEDTEYFIETLREHTEVIAMDNGDYLVMAF